MKQNAANQNIIFINYPTFFYAYNIKTEETKIRAKNVYCFINDSWRCNNPTDTFTSLQLHSLHSY